MKGNVESRLNLKNGDKTVDAKGWISWNEGDDPDPAWVQVTIVQGDRSGRGTCGPYHKPDDDESEIVEWNCDVSETNRKKFARTYADATAGVMDSALATSITDAWDATPILH